MPLPGTERVESMAEFAFQTKPKDLRLAKMVLISFADGGPNL
jgi:hypothetical protein